MLGAGISGLCTGYALLKTGFDVTVFEQNETPGGVIKSHRQKGWLVETGPNTIMVRKKAMWDFFDELNLTGQILEASKETKKRFLVRHEKLHAVPASFYGFLTTPLFSTGAKFRLIKEPFIKRAQQKDESLASFIKRRFGVQFLDYGVNPFIAGIYAGDPNKLSVKHTLTPLYKMEQKFGSVFKGLIKRKKGKTVKKALISFDEGMQVLIDCLSNELKDSLRMKSKVTQITDKDHSWFIATDETGNKFSDEYTAVISTLPPLQLSDIWNGPQSKEAINKLSSIEYAPVRVLSLGFKKEQVDHPLDGFGFLVPEKENFNLLGCLFSSSLFPNHAPENHTLLTCFIGGTRNPDLAGQPLDILLPKTMRDLDKLLGINDEPAFIDHAYWPRGIPQFNVGHDVFLSAVAEIESNHPGFFISGNFINGVSVPDCILSSFEMAKRVKNAQA